MEDLRKLVPKENTFSIIIPTCERENLVQRAINSIQKQTYPWWELIVVDDGSTDNTWSILEEIAKKDDRIKIFKHEIRLQRIIARNTGLKEAENEWICHLDSDDEYSRVYLEQVNYAIKKYPEYKVFNFGAITYKIDITRVREPYNLQEQNDFGEAMQRFQSGIIGMGSFVYKREIHDDVGYFPNVGVPYNFADAAKDEFPEMIEWYGTKDRSSVECKTLGNPVGDDYYLFYKITRKYKSKMLNIMPYIQYTRRGGFVDHDNDFKLSARGR